MGGTTGRNRSQEKLRRKLKLEKMLYEELKQLFHVIESYMNLESCITHIRVTVITANESKYIFPLETATLQKQTNKL